MTDAPTLGEALTDVSLLDPAAAVVLRISLYGTLTVCGECGGSGQRISSLIVARPIYENHGPCPRCQGTGQVRTGGLVERVEAAALEMHGWDDDAHLPACYAEALRAELGEALQPLGEHGWQSGFEVVPPDQGETP